VADTKPQRASCKVVERTCRIVLDVTVRVTEVTRESVTEHFTPSETDEGLTWEWAERQNRFLTALINDEEAFGRILASFAQDDLGLVLGSERIKGLPDGEEDRLYERIYSRMGKEDAAYFHEVQEEGHLWENLELFDRAIVTDWKMAAVGDVRVMGEGNRAGEENDLKSD
jgi:hypothetical protein